MRTYIIHTSIYTRIIIQVQPGVRACVSVFVHTLDRPDADAAAQVYGWRDVYRVIHLTAARDLQMFSIDQ